MATVSFRITDELKRELDELSAEKGYHLSKLFRRAIEDLRDTMRNGPDGGAFDLSLKDRLLLSNQYLILEMLDKEHATEHGERRKVLTGAQETRYMTLLEEFSNALNLEVTREVMDVLAMFTRLRLSYNHLGGRTSIAEEEIAFSGFNPEFEAEELGYAQFYMQKLGRHSWLNDGSATGIESSVPMLDVYRRMLSAWREIGMSKVLSEAEVAEVVNARNGMPATGAPASNRASTSTHH
jgi:uncharacterized protein YfbU (UPF0304 family)